MNLFYFDLSSPHVGMFVKKLICPFSSLTVLLNLSVVVLKSNKLISCYTL